MASGEESGGVKELVNGTSQTRAFLIAAGIGAMLIPAAFAIAAGLSIDLSALLHFRISDVIFGLAATLPLLALLYGFMIAKWRLLAEFRTSQLKFFSEIGFELTPMRIVALALIAGVSEELMFRGVLQTAADRQLPLVAAIVLPSILFGLLHARTILYAVIAGLVGVYLGVLFWATESLCAPIITHALYDYIAFDWTRRAIKNAGLTVQSGRAISSSSSVTG